jgi:hypothetical protein
MAKQPTDYFVGRGMRAVDARDLDERQDQLRMESRRKRVEELEIAGLGTRAIARALNVSDYTVRQDLKAIRGHRILEMGETSHLDRLMQSVAMRLAAVTELNLIINDRAIGAMARVQAIATKNNILDSIDRLQGTSAPDSVNSAAMAEFIQVVMEVVGDADPELARKVVVGLSQRTRPNSSVGAQLFAAVPGMTVDAGDAADEPDEDEPEPAS